MTQEPKQFELSDVKDSADPYSLYRTAREGGTVQRSGGTWLVLGHAEGSAIMRNSATRSGFIGEGYKSRLPPGAAREEMSHRINFIDPPRHGQVRKLISKAFTPRRTSQLNPFVEDLARSFLEGMHEDQPVDLLQAYAHEVPSLVISELLGVPVEHRDRLTVLSDRVSRLLGTGNTSEELTDAIKGAEEMHATLREVLEARRNEPKDDLLSALLAAEEGDDRLTESELLSLAATLYSAGHRTTRDLFSNGMTALLPDRQMLDDVRSGALPTPAVIEEFLRFETPTHMVARMLEEPLELDTVTIGAGEPIAIVLAAANRDPAAYDDAESFVPQRWLQKPAPPAPLSFALGAHFCLGASLARLEAATMLEVLVQTFPDVRLVDQPLAWHHTGVFRGVDHLMVVPGKRAS